MDKKQTLFISLIFLVTIACVVPGLSSTPPTPVFASTVDTGPIETRVVGTVSAAIAQTEQARPTATATFPATLLPISTTPAPTETPSLMANPSQSMLTHQEDSSTLFTDEHAGYEVDIPAKWLAVRVDEQEYLDAFSLEEAANANIQQSLLSIQYENPNTFRLLAIDTQPEDIQNEFVSDIRFVLNEQKNIDLSSDVDLQAIAQEISTSSNVFRFEVTPVKIFTSASGMQFGVIEAESSFTNPAGTEVPIYQKQVFFNTRSGTQSIVFTTVTDLKQITMPAFDTMLETISLIEK